MRLLLAALASTLLLSTAAFAQDAGDGLNTRWGGDAEPTFDFSGFHAGVHAGYGFGSSTTQPNLGFSVKPDGFVGGVYGGYDFQMENNIVLGLEADVSFGKIKADGNRSFSEEFSVIEDDLGQGYDSVVTDTFVVKNKIEASGTMRARFGYATGRFMPYLTGGLAWGKVKQSAYHTTREVGETHDWEEIGTEVVTDDDGNETTIPTYGIVDNAFDTSVTDSYGKTKTKWGYAIGAGVDYAVMDDLTLRFEYLYTDLGKVDYSYGSGDDIVGGKFKTGFSTIRVGMAYKF